MKAFFLAAGLGTRLRPFTETTAKPAIPFLGLPQIMYPYFFCKEFGVREIIYNTHHNPESVNDVFKNFNIPAKDYFEKDILNSAGGLSHARESLIHEKNFLLLNADSLFIYDKIDTFKDVVAKHISENRMATLFTITKEGCGVEFPGLIADSTNHLMHAGLKKDFLDSNLKDNKFFHFIGLYIFSNRIFNYISNKPDNLIYDILLKLPENEKENVKIENLSNISWYELGTIKDYKTNHLHLSNLVESDKDNSFTRAHKFFKSHFPTHYPYNNKLEQQILRSL